MPRYPSEQEDLNLAESVVFKPNNLTVKKITHGIGRTPDLLIELNGKCVAFCELKSPRDDWLDNLLDKAKPCVIVGGERDDPVFRKIRKHANKASMQFEAVNPQRSLPNILIFVNHDDSSGFFDLKETFTGYFYSADGSRYATMPDMAASLERAKKNIDLCIWIDGKTRRAEGYLFNQNANPNYLTNLCNLFGKDPSKIQC